MKKLILFVLLFAGTVVFAQKANDLLKEFDDLSMQFRDANLSVEKAKSLASNYLEKAKQSDEKHFIGRGYYLLALKETNIAKKLEDLDKSILYTKNLKEDAAFPMKAYFLKGAILDNDTKYEEALQNYFLALSEAKKNGNTNYQNYVKYNIAYLKRTIGKYEEALVLFTECLQYEEAKHTLDSNKYINILLLLSAVNFEMGKIEECSEINKKGILFTRKNNKPDFYFNFVVNEGINLTKKGAYKAAIDSLEKGRVHIEKPNQLTVDYYLAKSYYATNREEEGLAYFKKIDTSFDATSSMFIPLRGSYSYLIKDAKEKKDLKLQLYYTNRIIRIDSIIHANYKSIYENIKNDYDIPQLMEERDETIKILKEDNETISQKNKWIILISALFSVLMLGGFIYNYLLKKKYEKRYNEIMSQSNAIVEEEIIVKNATVQAVSLGIDPHIVDEVLLSLETFEKGETYLTNQISLKDVAKIVNTNSKYLSKIVNTYKGKNFTTYINDLRIDYLVNHVQTDTKYQKYTIRAIAEEIGFSNPEGFSRAFQKKTGLKPSYFIKKVRESSEKKQ